MFRSADAGDHGFSHQGDSNSCAGRHDNGRGQLPRADPRLAGFWNAIATGDRNAEPVIAVGIENKVRDGFARTHSHGVILRDDQINTNFLRGD